MSVGRNLQEMENVVTKGASPAESPSKSATPILTPGQTGSWEDLGGPTPENYRPDDDSSKLKDPSATLAQVRDVVNAKASAADSMKGVKEETEEDEDLVYEEDEDVGDARTKEAVREIKKACKKRHAKDFWSSNFDNWRTKYPNQFNNLSDCEFVKKFQSVTKDGNKYFVDNFGVNPSTCD